jgi:hypothetical protein
VSEFVNIKGLQEAQERMIRRIAKLKPSSKFGKVIKKATAAALRYLVTITHVDTGALKAAESMDITELRGGIFLRPGFVGNSGDPSVYGPFEFARGGDHGAPARTVEEAGPRIARQAIVELRSELV